MKLETPPEAIIIWSETEYNSRADYLQQLAEEYNIELYMVESIADLLGDSELFDGLVSSCQDMEG